MAKRIKNPNQGRSVDSTDPLFYLRKQFDAEFPTNADCVDALCQISGAERSCRKGCPNRDWIRVDDRTIQCSECHEKVYLTSGTFFENIRRVREWLFVVWIYEHRIEANPNRFSAVTGVSYSTAWVMFRKIAMIITDLVLEMDAVDEVRSAEWLDLMTRRSRETEARQNPDSEEIELSLRELVLGEPAVSVQDSAENAEIQADARVRMADNGLVIVNELVTNIEGQVLQRLNDEPIFIDVLREQTGLEIGELASALVMLQLNGVVVRLPGDRYVRATQTGDANLRRSASGHSAAEVRRKIIGASEFIWNLFQGVSRKYLQHYVCIFSYFTNALQLPRGTLLKACLAADAISAAEIRNYVSPPLIRLL